MNIVTPVVTTIGAAGGPDTMRDMENVTPSDSPASNVPAPRPPARAPRSGAALALLAALLAIGVGGTALWRGWVDERSGRDAREAQDAALARLDGLQRNDEQLRRDLDALRARLGDAESVNRSLREELLGVTERARTLEDAVANLSEQHLNGRDALALNEAEFVLQLGAERLALFHDPDAALVAYRLADSALAAAEDPLFASVRQTIAAEVQALEAARPQRTQATLEQIERLREGLATLPAAPTTTNGADAPVGRLRAALERFVRIRHDDVATAPGDVALSRALIALDLRTAEAALLARDADAYAAALRRARTAAASAFDGARSEVTDALGALDRLAATPLAPALPELGTALKELRNLRVTRALSRHPGDAVPPPAVERDAP